MSSTHEWSYLTESPVPNATLNDVLESLTDRRRVVLAVVLDRPTPVDERDLATRLAAERTGDRPGEVSEEAVRSARIDLRHTHLPALEASDLLEWDRQAETVARTDHLLYEDPQFRRFVNADADVELEDVGDCLSAARRRRVLAVLDDRDAPLELGALAGAVAERESDTEASDVATALHHVHLPKLEAAGLVELHRRHGHTFVSRTPRDVEGWFAFLD